MGIFGLIHEAGHGVYEQNIAEKFEYTPVHEGASMGIHESQSLFNELVIASRKSFWQKQYPFFCKSALMVLLLIFHLQISMPHSNRHKPV